MTWAVTQAKAKFSEVLDKAEAEGPQLVRRRKREFYVMTREQRDADRIDAKSRSASESHKTVGSLGDFFRNSPLAGSGIEIKRIKSAPRPVKF